jgi:Uma2 family endonuclease
MRYRSILMLKEYWNLSSYEYRLQKFLKNEKDNSWALSEITNPADEVLLSSFGVTIPLKEICEGTEMV